MEGSSDEETGLGMSSVRVLYRFIVRLGCC